MRKPFDRSSGSSEISPYAPKWARSLDAATETVRRAQGSGDKFSPDRPANDFGETSAPRPHLRSLDPSIVPGPPVPESWLLDEVRPLLHRSGARMFFRFFVVVVFAASISFAIALFLPAARRLVLPQTATRDSAATPGRTGPRPTVQPAPVANRSELPPTPPKPSATPAERFAPPPAWAIAPLAVTPYGDAVPPKQKSTGSAWGNPTPSADASARSAAVDSKAPASTVPVVTVKTVPIHRSAPERPLNPDEINTLLKQGADFVSVGDFASARIVFRRVAAARDARGALALAATYDPIALQKIDAKGGTPDIAKALQWYAKAIELGAREAGPRMAALEQSTGASAARASSDAGAKAKKVDETGKQSRDEAAARNAWSDEVSGTTASYWKNGASIVRLEAKGALRKFVFLKPSEEEAKAGAKAGSLRFDGKISRSSYAGTAFSYSKKCGRESFFVSGDVENKGSRVVLIGKAPRMNGDCRVIGKSEQTLVFDFLQSSGK